MKKILFVNHTSGWGGPANSLIRLINELDQSKYSIKVLLLKPSNIADKLKENGIDYCLAESRFYLKYYRFFPHSEAGYIKWYQIHYLIMLGVLWLLSRYIFAERELRRHDYDIVHLNSSVLTDWLAPSKARGKVIIHIREPFRKGWVDPLHYFFRSRIKKYADQIIAISHDNASRLNLLSRTKVIYDFWRAPDIPVQDTTYASKKILYLGGSSTSKGFYTVVDALEYLDKDVQIYYCGHYATEWKTGKILVDVMRWIIGYGRKREKAIQKIHANPNAKLIGLIYNVGEYLSEVCCLISPFTVPHFSCPVFESYLFAKPAIGSDVAGMEEIIWQRQTGLIFKRKSALELAQAINELTSHPEIAKQYGQEGYKVAIERFSPKNIAKFESIYDSL